MGGVRFVRSTVQEIAEREPGAFDVVVLSDVMHHVPVDLRQGLLEGIRAAMRPGATFVFKDWERNFSPIHWMGYASDRWLTGDRIRYMTRSEMRERLARTFGAGAMVAEARVPPWWNNLALLVRPA
jgi:2-polyprenyl-6-hydroxyphenyl methylase/3-demethylubiquinone-9 3-methyltransferase